MSLISAGNSKGLGSSSSYSEKPRTPIAVGPLKLSHIRKSINTWHAAFDDDPMQRYVSTGVVDTPRIRAIRNVCMSIILALSIMSKISLTVNGGAAFLLGNLVKDEWGPKQKIAQRIISLMFKLMRKVSSTSAERENRRKEIREKTEGALETHFGERMKDMIDLELLATHPLSQGKGYGGALIQAFTTLADIKAYPAWLFSSNEKNIKFYNSHGFETVTDVVLGDTNPTWHEPPIIIKLMVREYKSPGEKAEV